MLFDFPVTILHNIIIMSRWSDFVFENKSIETTTTNDFSSCSRNILYHVLVCVPSKTRVPKTHYRYQTISVRTRTAAVEVPVRLHDSTRGVQHHARWTTTGKRFADETELSITAAYMQNVSLILYVTLLRAFRYHIILFCRSIM